MNSLKCKARFSRLLSFFLVVVLLGALFLAACSSRPGTEDGSGAADAANASGSEAGVSESPSSLQELAEQIAGEYGKVDSVVENDSDVTVFVFPENHASMLQRIEIAIMLNRLYATQDVLHLGLEGWMQDDPPMELSWAHRPPPYVPGEPITSREDVLAHMLMEGEYSSMEFMGLIYEDVVVHGIDDAELYAETIDYSVRLVPLDYLYAIALATMSDDDLGFWSGLADDEDYEKAFEFAILSTDYTEQTMNGYENLESTEEQQVLLQEIIDKAEEVSAELRSNEVENMQALLDYIDVVAARSDVFAESVVEIGGDNPGAAVPTSFHLDEDPSLLSLEAYERKEAGLSPGGPGSIGAIVSGRMPEPIANDELIITLSGIREFMQVALSRNVSFWMNFSPNISGKSGKDLKEELEPGLVDDLREQWDKLVNQPLKAVSAEGWEFEYVRNTPPSRSRTDRRDHSGVLYIRIKKPEAKDWIDLALWAKGGSGAKMLGEVDLDEALNDIRSSFAQPPPDLGSPPEVSSDREFSDDYLQACSNTVYTTSTGQ
jgi:hypothetical protein